MRVCIYCIYVDGAFEFEWDEANTAHLTHHEVTREEFEQIFKYSRLEEQQTVKDEQRVRGLGRTDAGRYLTFVYTVRGTKLRAITAYTTKRKYRRLYDQAIQTEASVDDSAV